jgi:hypothetical protein
MTFPIDVMALIPPAFKTLRPFLGQFADAQIKRAKATRVPW